MQFLAINAQNEVFVEKIFAGETAQYWVHYNSYWLENSRQHSDIEAYLIYVEGLAEPIGFIAYGQHYQDETLTEAVLNTYEIIHLVIDHAHQGKGYGKAATLLAIETLKKLPDCQEILIAHHPENLAAKKLYESLGFIAFGRNYDDDPLLKLKLQR